MIYRQAAVKQGQGSFEYLVAQIVRSLEELEYQSRENPLVRKEGETFLRQVLAQHYPRRKKWFLSLKGDALAQNFHPLYVALATFARGRSGRNPREKVLKILDSINTVCGKNPQEPMFLSRLGHLCLPQTNRGERNYLKLVVNNR